MRIGELLGALSLATDLAVGAPFETSLRTCVLATRIARGLGIEPLLEVRRVALLRHLGCTAYAHEAARLAAGDDHDLFDSFAGVDRGRHGAVVGRALTRLARDAPLGQRFASVVRVLSHPGAGNALVSAQCTQAMALAHDLGMSGGVADALGQIYERHDGRGDPSGIAGDAIRPSARVLHLAELVEIHHRYGGRDRAVDEVRRRRGKHVATEIADAFLADPDHYWDVVEAPSVWDRYREDDDPDEPTIGVLDVARAFGRFADLKSTYRLGHSGDVADLVVRASGEPAAGGRAQLAALLHDLGTVSVPNGIWDKPGPLNDSEWERVRLHGYHTERILARTPVLADVAMIAGSHHERLDGSGYHRGVNASQLDRDVRLIAAADVFQAMRSVRPHRAALPIDRVVAELAGQARDGRLCKRAVDAILATVGHRAPAQPGDRLPAGLTRREIEVLVHLARGHTNKQIASSLGIALRTTNHHVENIYTKIGVTTRAAAALFAVRHDLVSVDHDPTE